MHRYHNVANRLMKICLHLGNAIVGDIQAKFEEYIVDIVEVIDKFKTVIIHGRDGFMLIAVLLQGVSTVFTTGDNINVCAGQQIFYDGLEIVFCQFTVKNIFPFADHPATVFRHK